MSWIKDAVDEIVEIVNKLVKEDYQGDEGDEDNPIVEESEKRTC